MSNVLPTCPITSDGWLLINSLEKIDYQNAFISSLLVWNSLPLCWAYKLLCSTVIFTDASRLVTTDNISKDTWNSRKDEYY